MSRRAQISSKIWERKLASPVAKHQSGQESNPRCHQETNPRAALLAGAGRSDRTKDFAHILFQNCRGRHERTFPWSNGALCRYWKPCKFSFKGLFYLQPLRHLVPLSFCAPPTFKYAFHRSNSWAAARSTSSAIKSAPASSTLLLYAVTIV